jgi:hypothetical protein
MLGELGLEVSPAPSFWAWIYSDPPSAQKFCSWLTFEDFVKAAGGHPSHALQLLLWTYDVLEEKVYSTFVRNSDRLGLLVELKEVCDTYHKSTPILRSDNFEALKKVKAGAFVLHAIERAWKGVTLKRPPRDEEGKKETKYSTSSLSL